MDFKIFNRLWQAFLGSILQIPSEDSNHTDDTKNSYPQPWTSNRTEWHEIIFSYGHFLSRTISFRISRTQQKGWKNHIVRISTYLFHINYLISKTFSSISFPYFHCLQSNCIFILSKLLWNLINLLYKCVQLPYNFQEMETFWSVMHSDWEAGYIDL